MREPKFLKIRQDKLPQRIMETSNHITNDDGLSFNTRRNRNEVSIDTSKKDRYQINNKTQFLSQKKEFWTVICKITKTI
ncbi:MAG TPA: hypothetical protein VFM31_11430 [Nitrososphaeraceae archaeon]|nr:hypothetical protein [Nitrososphaeraceae archaeon]